MQKINKLVYSDKEAIISIKNGNIDDFSYIVHAYSKQIIYFVKKKLFNSHDVDDIVQESFLSFYKALTRFDENKPVLPYLYEIVKNQLKMYYRSHKTHISLSDEMIHNQAKEPVLHIEEDIYTYLDKLTEIQKHVLLLVSKGYTYDEIANDIHKPINTVRTLIRRARLKVIRLKNIYERS